MAPVEFYRRIGREDLAQEYTAREIRRNELMTAGAVIGLGSLVASAIIVTNALSSANCDVNNQPAFGQCLAERSSRADSGLLTASVVGLGGGLLGGALLLAGASINPNPINASQMRELADGYNHRLRQQLGMSVRPLASPDTPQDWCWT